MKKLINQKDSFFVAGSNGMVGKAFLKALKKRGYCEVDKGGEIYNPNREELNLLNYEDVKRWFENNKPKIVIVAAAKVGVYMQIINRLLSFYRKI